MFAEANLEYSLNLPSRCISSLPSDKLNHRYMVGTCFTEGTYENQYNEIHMLRYDEELNEIITECIYHHRIGEIWCLCPCPKSRELVVTSGGKNGDCSLWKFEDMDNLDDDDNPIGGSNKEMQHLKENFYFLEK